LKKGAAEVRWDNTIANLHAGEGVLTRDLNAKFQEGVNNFANGPSSEYNVKVIVNGGDFDDIDQLADKIVDKLQKIERRKPHSRRA
jgi:hypothetical protein